MFQEPLGYYCCQDEKKAISQCHPELPYFHLFDVLRLHIRLVDNFD